MSYIGYFPFRDGAKMETNFTFLPRPQMETNGNRPRNGNQKTHRSDNSEQCVLLYGNGAVSGR